LHQQNPRRTRFKETQLADFVDSTVKELDSRMSLLKEELAKLEAARAALVGNARRGPGRPRGSTSTTTAAPARRTGRRPGRPRGRRSGTRGAQALDLVRSQPGITIPQIAESLKIEPNYLYRVMPKLVADGQVKRDGQGWYPAS
jgi:hypothetical protein